MLSQKEKELKHAIEVIVSKQLQNDLPWPRSILLGVAKDKDLNSSTINGQNLIHLAFQNEQLLQAILKERDDIVPTVRQLTDLLTKGEYESKEILLRWRADIPIERLPEAIINKIIEETLDTRLHGLLLDRLDFLPSISQIEQNLKHPQPHIQRAYQRRQSEWEKKHLLKKSTIQEKSTRSTRTMTTAL